MKYGLTYVYVLTSGRHRKIGAANDVKRRMYYVQKMCPDPIKLVDRWYRPKDAYDVEQMAHRLLSGQPANVPAYYGTEWYSASAKRAKQAVELAIRVTDAGASRLVRKCCFYGYEAPAHEDVSDVDIGVADILEDVAKLMGRAAPPHLLYNANCIRHRRGNPDKTNREVLDMLTGWSERLAYRELGPRKRAAGRPRKGKS